MLKAKQYSTLEMPEFLPFEEMAFNSSTHELYIGMGENEPIKKVTDSTLEGSPIDYFGNAYKSLKERMDSDVEHLVDGFSLVEYTGSRIHATNTFAKQVKNAVLKGRTLVNCIQEPSSQDVVLPYEFEDGQYITINDTKESGALDVELKGQTLVNLNKTTYPVTNWGTNENNNNYYHDYDTLASGMFKQLTNYLFKIYGLSNPQEIQLQGTSNVFTDEIKRNYRFNENGCLILTSTETILNFSRFTPHFKRVNVNNLTTNEMNNLKMIILEYQDGMENLDIPYFEGMTSCKMPTLRTVGKNLFNPVVSTPYSMTCNDGKTDGGLVGVIPVKPNTTYTLSVDKDLTKGRFIAKMSNKILTSLEVPSFSQSSVYNYLRDNYANGRTFEYIIHNQKSITFTTLNDCYYIYVNVDRSYGSPVTGDVVVFSNMSLEESPTLTTYEDHKSSILSLPEEVVLRSLPNGVCDTFNTRTCIYTQRIGDDIFIGASNENWGTPNTYNTGNTMSFRIKKPTMQGDGYTVPLDIICDKMKIETPRNAWGNDGYDEEGLSHGTGKGDGVDVRILKSKLPTENVAGFKQWLAQNPIRVQYQLHTPIVTKINLPSTLKSWNTTTHIYSEIPENSLYPILSHSNPTYPVMLKPNTKYSIVADSHSNGHTNSAINFNLGGANASTVVGSRITTITTPSTLSNELLTMSGRGNKLNNVMVIEGDVVGDEPYFEGMQSVRMPKLRTTGKNLFDAKEFCEKLGLTYLEGGFLCTTSTKKYPFKTNRRTCMTLKHKGDSNAVVGKSIIQVNFTDGTVGHTSLANLKYVWNKPIDSIQVNSWQGGTVEVTEIMWYEVNDDETLYLDYEPFKSNILSVPIESHKGFNDVCDTVDCITGEKVERIGEMVLNGSENWKKESTNTSSGDTDTTTCYYVAISNIRLQAHCNFACEQLPYRKVILYHKINDYEGISNCLGDSRIFIRINQSRLTEQNVNGFKQWLSQNPITIQYELETPVIETVDLEGQKVYSYDGTTHFVGDSEEGSLLPTATIQVPTKISAFRGDLASDLATANVQSKENVSELEVVKTSIAQGDLELLANDFELDFRLFEIELSLPVALYLEARTNNKIYSTAKSLILGNYYDFDSMTNRLSLLSKHGRITVEQHEELLSLMKGDNEHESD